jgi:SAM-dependent methyltransferase
MELIYRAILEKGFKEFNTVYNNNIDDCFGLLNNATPEFIHYAFTLKHLQKIRQTVEGRIPKCLDIGGHLGILASLFSELGYKVTNIDSSKHFSPTLYNNALRYMKEKQVDFLDIDLMSPGLKFPIQDDQIDVVVFQAVIEHLPHSPRLILNEISRVLKKDGTLIICTPNGGTTGVRWKILKNGSWPYWDLRGFYDSDIPFLGHHRLYSINDLDNMAKWSGFYRDKGKTIFFDQTEQAQGTLKWRIFWKLIYQPIIYKFFPTWRDGIWATYKKQ